MSWRESATCRGKNTNIWYPPLDADNPEQYYAVAREVCHICPVWRECLKDGLSENWGMWGGLTPLERSVFRDSPKKTAYRTHGTATRYRQGCVCNECVDAHTLTIKQEKDINVVPSMGEEDFDLFTVLYRLLQ